MATVARDESRTEHDDFVLNVQPLMGKYDGATLMGEIWVIKPMYE